MENPSLTGPRLKFNRAIENLNCLKRDIDAFVKDDPHRVTVQFEAEAGCHVARLTSVKEPDPMLGVKVGEFAHNLRSSLDHMAWQVARIRNSEKVCKNCKRKIYFPVCQTAEDFKCFPLLGLLGEPEKAFLDFYQPYHRQDGPRQHWLSSLNRIWNADKHRLVHAVQTLSNLGRTTFAPAVLSPNDDSPWEVEPLLEQYRDTGIHEGAEIAHIRFERSDPERQQVHVKRQPPAEVFFSAGRDAFRLRHLTLICGEVALLRGGYMKLIEQS